MPRHQACREPSDKRGAASLNAASAPASLNADSAPASLRLSAVLPQAPRTPQPQQSSTPADKPAAPMPEAAVSPFAAANAPAADPAAAAKAPSPQPASAADEPPASAEQRAGSSYAPQAPKAEEPAAEAAPAQQKQLPAAPESGKHRHEGSDRDVSARAQVGGKPFMEATSQQFQCVVYDKWQASLSDLTAEGLSSNRHVNCCQLHNTAQSLTFDFGCFCAAEEAPVGGGCR